LRASTRELELRDLAARPSALAALPASLANADLRAASTAEVDAPPLDDDPHI